jgi:hypothetical protein
MFFSVFSFVSFECLLFRREEEENALFLLEEHEATMRSNLFNMHGVNLC